MKRGLTAPTETLEAAPEPLAPQSSNQYLLVVQTTSASIYSLQPGSTVLIGRSPSANLRLDDGATSREHARVSVSETEASLVDLGSQNGTRINGQRVRDSQRLLTGDVVLIGNTSLVYHGIGSTRPERVPLTWPGFRQRLEEEVARSARFGNPFTLFCVALGEGPSKTTAALEALQTHTRTMDVLGVGGPDQLMLLLPETPKAEGIELATRLMQKLESIVGDARAGVASCPADACSAEALIAGARNAVSIASEDHVAAAEEDFQVVAMGDRHVIVADAAMKSLYALAGRLAKTDLPVLIGGETGTGKELAARAIHDGSKRSAKPLVSINCAAIHDNLLESELFGHERGAFSGAVTTKLGQLEVASGGTVFLDEIGELHLTAQGKLLRVLEEKRLTRVGGVKEIAVDIRIVAATHRDLRAEVGAGRFRQDLFFRLSGATLWIPPLRDRPRELPLLARHFLEDACRRAGCEAKSISSVAMQELMKYQWPGNIRELRNVMDFLAAAVEQPQVLPRHVQDRIRSMVNASSMDKANAAKPVVVSSTAASEAPLPGASFRAIDEEVQELERTRMLQALKAAHGNQSQAARLISMPLRTFTTKLRRYGLLTR